MREASVACYDIYFMEIFTYVDLVFGWKSLIHFEMENIFTFQNTQPRNSKTGKLEIKLAYDTEFDALAYKCFFVNNHAINQHYGKQYKNDVHKISIQ